jgi:hypothetical protein
MLGLSTTQVYLAKHRMSRVVKAAAKQVEAEMNRAAAVGCSAPHPG